MAGAFALRLSVAEPIVVGNREIQRVRVELTTDVAERLKAAAEDRGTSVTKVIGMGMDAYYGANTVQRSIPYPSEVHSSSLELVLDPRFAVRLKVMRRKVGWNTTDLVTACLDALDATEARSCARLIAGTHRIERVEASFECLLHLEKVLVLVPRTASDLIGFEMSRFNMEEADDEPPTEGHATGYLDLELPVH